MFFFSFRLVLTRKSTVADLNKDPGWVVIAGLGSWSQLGLARHCWTASQWCKICLLFFSSFKMFFFSSLRPRTKLTLTDPDESHRRQYRWSWIHPGIAGQPPNHTRICFRLFFVFCFRFLCFFSCALSRPIRTKVIPRTLLLDPAGYC